MLSVITGHIYSHKYTMGDHSVEELNNLRGLVVKLAKEIDYKNHLLLEKKDLSLEKFATLSCLLEEKDRLLGERSEVIGGLMAQKYRLNEAFVEGMQNFEEMKLELRKVKQDLEVEKQKHHCQTRKLVEHPAETDKGPGTAIISYPSTRGYMMSPEINPIVQAECCKLEERKSLTIHDGESERQYLRMHDEELKTQIDILKKELDEKGKALLEIESLNQTLLSKESLCNEELQAARTEAIACFQSMDDHGTKIGIKRLGEIDPKAFQDACSIKFCGKDCEENFNKLYCSWQENVSDPSWNPFKKKTIYGKLRQVVDENDRKLRKLRKEWGEEAYKAVASALFDLSEYNPDTRCSIPELWNFEEGRKANLKEVIQHIIQRWNVHRDKVNQHSTTIAGLTAEKERLLDQLADVNTLMKEKDKLLNEKYAAIGELMTQDVKKEKLLGKMSVTVSTLTAENRILLENCNPGKGELQRMMKHIEKLNKMLQSKEEELLMITKELKDRKDYNKRGKECIIIKEEASGDLIESWTEQVEPFAKKLKHSEAQDPKKQYSSKSGNQKLQGQNIEGSRNFPRAEPDMSMKQPDEGTYISGLPRPSTHLYLLPS